MAKVSVLAANPEAETDLGRVSGEDLVRRVGAAPDMQRRDTRAGPVEMQRRLILALERFESASDRSSDILIRLTWVLVFLTIVITALTVVMALD